MRAPKRRHPRSNERVDRAKVSNLAHLAARAQYVISAEHKDYLTSAGPGKLRSDASACPRGINFGEVESWLKDAIAKANASADIDGDFPRYVWARVGDRVYEARLSNSVLGQYKGYPIHDYEAPGWLE